MEQRLLKIEEIIKTVSQNYEEEISAIFEILELRIAVEYPKNNENVKKLAKLVKEVRKLNQKQIKLGSSIFENFELNMENFTKLKHEGFNEGYESAKKNIIQSKNREFSKIEQLKDEEITQLKS